MHIDHNEMFFSELELRVRSSNKSTHGVRLVGGTRTTHLRIHSGIERDLFKKNFGQTAHFDLVSIAPIAPSSALHDDLHRYQRKK